MKTAHIEKVENGFIVNVDHEPWNGIKGRQLVFNCAAALGDGIQRLAERSPDKACVEKSISDYIAR